MAEFLKHLCLRLRLAKDSLQKKMPPGDGAQRDDQLAHVALPSHALLCTCESCGVAYAEDLWRDSDDPDDEGRYCRMCIGKRQEDKKVRNEVARARKTHLPVETLWGR